jgi:hypothetical protein
MQILDRVLNGDDSARSPLVDPIQECGEGRGFAGSGGSRDQNESLAQLRHLVDHLGQAQVLKRWDIKGKTTQSTGNAPPLEEYIASEPADPIHGEREVQFQFSLEGFYLLFVDNLIDRVFYLLWSQLLIGRWNQFLMDPKTRRSPCTDVQVCPPSPDKLFK